MTEQDALFDVEQFIYVKIPEAILPLDRGSLFEDPIEAALQSRDLGCVSGGGSLLGASDVDGKRSIEFCGIDIDTTDRTAALVFLREFLPTLGIPLASELHYTADGRKLQDRFLGAAWAIGEHREFLHPGFDI